MRKNRYIAIIFILTLLSCYKASPIEVESGENAIVINSIMQSDDTPLVQVSRTSTDFTTPIPVIDAAVVELYQNQSKIATLRNIEDGKYASRSVKYEEGEDYHLSVSLNNETYKAEQKIPKAREIYKVIHLNNAGKTYDNITYPGIKLYISNNPSQRLYFQLRIFSLGNLNLTTPHEVQYIEFHDSLFNRQGLDIPIFTNETITGDTIEVQLNYSTGFLSGFGSESLAYDLYPIVIELNTISEDYYKFLRSVYLYEQGRFPDFINSPPPVFSTYSNVKNGLGIVAGISTVKTDTIYP